MRFAERTPSTAWEPVPLAGSRCVVWAWFRPAAAPQGLFLRIPDETFRDAVNRGPLTVRSLLHAMEIDPGDVATWSVFGVPNSGLMGSNPALDFLIPAPGPGVDPTIVILLHPQAAAGATGAVAAPRVVALAAPSPVQHAPAGYAPPELFARIETAWNSSLQLEVQLAAVAKQLSGMLLRINSLNRDLSFDENRCADQADKRDWQETRRWLRDISARLSRSLKDHHMGVTSAAGKRNWFETTYQQQIVPRRPFEGMEQAEREYDLYRKTMQTLLNNMTAAYGSAAQDGERRAQLVLTRIASKVRTSRSKR